MDKKIEDILKNDSYKLFQKVSDYVDDLINEATVNGALSASGADNEYTREIGRAGKI